MKVGLSLSGGGYRAAAFHLGTLKRLHQLEILQKVDVLSTVSGGSIVGAYYCLNKDDFDMFEQSMISILTKKSIIRYVLTSFSFLQAVIFILAFPTLAIWLFVENLFFLGVVTLFLQLFLLIKYQFKIFPISKEIEKAYNSYFFNEANLSDLPDFPELAIASTNLQTCRPFTFSKRKMEDSYYAHRKPPVKFNNKNFPLARAVAASTCVPFAFSPIRIDKQFFQKEEDFKQVSPKLVDGGVYDNQGIQKLTQKGSSYECDIVITSDAGNKLPFEKAYNNTFALLLRTVDTFMARIKNFQMMQHLYDAAKSRQKEVAYLSLGWDFKNSLKGFLDALKEGRINSRTIEAHRIPQEWLEDWDKYKSEVRNLIMTNVQFERLVNETVTQQEETIARSVSTNLTTLSMNQINCLMKHAENLTEIQVRLYCPSLLI